MSKSEKLPPLRSNKQYTRKYKINSSYFEPKLLAFRCFGINLLTVGVTDLRGVLLTTVVPVVVQSSVDDLDCFLWVVGLQPVTLITGDKMSLDSERRSCGDDSSSLS